MLAVIYAKILYHSFIPTIYENFNSVFLRIKWRRKFGNLYAGLTVQYLNKLTLSQKLFSNSFHSNETNLI